MSKNLLTSASAKEPLKLLVALDFGTTFSAMAYAQSKRHHKQEVIQSWGVGKTGEKVPTVLQYDEDLSPGSGASRWGFGVDLEDDESGTRYEWFKLGLYPRLDETGLMKQYPPKIPEVNEAEAKKLVIDYLTALKQNFEQVMKRRIRSSILDDTPIEYIITVPAIWTDKSKNLTRECAVRAGMGSKHEIQIIKEPEAAGIYALDNMGDMDLDVGDTFVVCDAGGGTVDLISYTVQSLNPPVLTEAAQGSGGLCGGSFLNRIFANFLDKKFRKYPAFDDGLKKHAMKVFENDIKKWYVGVPDKPYNIMVRGLPDNAQLGISRERLEITGEDLKGIFEPVVTEIVTLVKSQIKATPKKVKSVLLAGGFGESEYLRSVLYNALKPDGIHVQQIPNSNTAIVRGALIRGLTRMNKQLPYARSEGRIATRSYGTPKFVEFDPREGHDEARKEEGGFIQVMDWFIQQGTSVDESKPRHVQLTARKPVGNTPFEPMKIRVFSHEDHTGRQPLQYMVDDANVEELVTLTAKLDVIPQRSWYRKRNNDGDEFDVVDFDIAMTLNSASLLTFKMVHAGVNDDNEEAVEAEFK